MRGGEYRLIRNEMSSALKICLCWIPGKERNWKIPGISCNINENSSKWHGPEPGSGPEKFLSRDRFKLSASPGKKTLIKIYMHVENFPRKSVTRLSERNEKSRFSARMWLSPGKLQALINCVLHMKESLLLGPSADLRISGIFPGEDRAPGK